MATDYLNVALPLGIGGATPFPMSSNHPTVGNHSFRDLKRPSIMTDSEQSQHKKLLQQQQLRVKCTFCGCWATRGENCKQCRRPIAPAKQRRNNNVRVTVYRAGEGGGPQSESTMMRSSGNGTKRSPLSPNDKTAVPNPEEGGKGTRSARLSSYGQRMREELLQRSQQKGRGGRQDARGSKASPSSSPSYAFPPPQQEKNVSAPIIIGVDNGSAKREDSEIHTSDRNEDGRGSAALQAAAAAEVTGVATGAAAATMVKSVVKCKRCACFALTNAPCSLCFYVN